MTSSTSSLQDGIKAQGLTKTYQRGQNSVPALVNVDLHLPQGTQVALMGPSGSGKSTLLHCMAGILRPTSGSVHFDGADITRMKDKDVSRLRLSRFGFVFQDGQLLPELPANENVALPLMLLGLPRAKAMRQADDMLAKLGLQGLGPHRPGQLSGGQAQRVSIARALITGPGAVFADEPTGALDQNTGAEVMDVLTRACAATGASLILVTHDPGVAARLPYTIHMRDGQIVEGVHNDASSFSATPAAATLASGATPVRAAL